MHRTIFIYTTILTLLGTTYSKSVTNDEDIEGTTSESFATPLPDLFITHESESDTKQSSKRSLLILMPVDEKKKTREFEETEDVINRNQKTKRCKTPLLRGSNSLPTLKGQMNQDIVGSRNVNSYKNGRATGYSVNQNPRLRLVSLKNPDTAAKRDPMPRGKGEDAADRGDKVDITKAIREKLESRDYNVGGARSNLLRKTNIIDDDKYICYCREKTKPSFRKETTRDFTPKPEWLTRGSKPERKDGNKVFLSESKLRQKPIYTNAQRQPFLPALYTDAHQYLPTHLPNHVKPLLQQKGNEGVPYVPYFYHMDPELAMLPEAIHRANPTKINIPFSPIGGGPDSLVGQSINRGHDRHNDQQIVGQRACPPTNAGKSGQEFQKTIPATSSSPITSNVLKNKDPYYSMKIDEENVRRGESKAEPSAADYNLQSMHSKFPEFTTLTFEDDRDHSKSTIQNDDAEKMMQEQKEVSTESSVQGTISAMGDNLLNVAKSSDNSGENSSNGYETTGSETLNYSDIREVTSGYFEANSYSESGEPSQFDNFHTSSDGSENSADNMNYDANVQNFLHPTSQTLVESDESGNQSPFNKVPDHQPSLNKDFKELSPNGVTDFGKGTKNSEDNKDIVVGNSNPSDERKEPTTDDLNQNADGIVQYGLNPPCYFEDEGFIEEVTPLIYDLESSNEGDVSKNIKEFFAKDYSNESPEMKDNGSPLRNDYEEENLGSDNLQQKMQDMDKKDGEGLVGETLTKTMDSINPESGATTNEDTINMNNENVMVTPQYENEDNTGSILQSPNIESVGKTINPSVQGLPFCDNTLLQKAIKTVINNFATDSSNMEENANEETVSSTGEDLLQDIIKVPNLKNIVSLPPIEHTILDKVKNLLARLTNVVRTQLDNDWVTKIIRDNLRNTMAAAPVSNAELPPMTVAEHQFKDGKWVTNLVTLEPTSNEEAQIPSDLKRLQATIKSLLRDPAVGLQAAKEPAVQNMIVQSVRKTFEPKNTTNNEGFDDSVIQGALDKELSLMEMEETESTTITNPVESETVDISNMDMKKFLEIAKNEAGIKDDKNDESSIASPSEGNLMDSNAYGSNPVTSVFQGSTDKELPDASDIVSSGLDEFNPDKAKPEQVTNPYRKDVSSEDSSKKETTNSAETSGTFTSILREENLEAIVPSTTKPFTHNIVGATRIPKFPDYSKSSSTETIVHPTVHTDGITEQLEEVKDRETVSTETSFNVAAVASTNKGEDQGNSENIEGSTNTKFPSDDASPEHDYTYLGKISVKKNNNKDNVQSLQNSELYYVGDGVKLPLEIRKLDDGSFALSISRKVCEQLLNKECPCCVPVKGHVVQTLKKNTEAEDVEGTIKTSRRTKRISKRDSFKSILPDEIKKWDSTDNKLEIFSMPVESFAKKYNLSLNLEKVQAPWNFEVKRNIDERPNERTKNLQNEEEYNADTIYGHDLLSIHAGPENSNEETSMMRVQRMDDQSEEESDEMHSEYRPRRQRQRNFNRYRYERNIDEPVNERAEIVKSVLNWLREMILTTISEKH